MSTLHQTRTVQALLPRYVTRFTCIGSECEDNCCTGWRVSIDKKTFNAYRKIASPSLSARLSHDVKRQRSEASDSNYARIELKPESKECPFMEAHLCSIQRDIGESYLSNTCFSFPRQSRNFFGQHEQALTLSCPEAARQALLAADAFDFVEAKITVRAENVGKVSPPKGMLPGTLNDARIFCLQLMRTPTLELWQRLAILGVFCESLADAVKKLGHSEIPLLLASFAKTVENGEAVAALAEMQSDHLVQAQVFAIIWEKKASQQVSATQSRVVEAVSIGLGYGKGGGKVSSEELVARYSRGISLLPKALSAAPHLLENYLLNEIFREVFPFEGADPYKNYLRLVSRFGLLRLMLAAQCTDEKDLPDTAALVHTVHVLCRMVQHDSKFSEHVNSALQNSGWAKLEKIFSFLKT